MNWYKTASLIDNVQVSAYTSDTIVLLLYGNRYEYSGVTGPYLEQLIRSWKMMKNKRQAGERMSVLIKNLKPNLVKR